MTAVEESPILIPSEDEDDDDDIVVVKEEKIPITIDENEDVDQDGEVIFVAQTSAPSAAPWARAETDSTRLRLISDKETSAAAAAIATSPCSSDLSTIASVSTAMSPSPCSADLSSIEDVGDDLGEGHESKPTLQRNLSLASTVDFSLSLEDADQSPLDLSKSSNAGGKAQTGIDLAVLASHPGAGQYMNDVASSRFDSSSNSSIRFDRVGSASANPAVLVSSDSQAGLHSDVPILGDPFAIPSTSQAVIGTTCPPVRQLGVSDSSNNSTVLVNQDLKVANVLMDFSAASTSTQVVGSSNLPSVSSASSAAGSVKLSAAPSTSTDSSTQLLVDFLMQDDTLSQVLVPATTCPGPALQPVHSLSSSVVLPSVSAAASSQSPTLCPPSPYLGQSTSGNPAVIKSKPHFMNSTKPEDLSSGSVGVPGLCVPGVRMLVRSPTGFQQQSSGSGGSGVSSPLDFAQIIAQVLDQHSDVSGSPGAASSLMSSSSSSVSTCSSTLSSSSSTFSSTSTSTSSSRTSAAAHDASVDNVNPASTLKVPAPLSAKRNSTTSLSTLDNSSLPPRKRVRSLILDSAVSSTFSPSPLGGKSASFSEALAVTDKRGPSLNQSSVSSSLTSLGCKTSDQSDASVSFASSSKVLARSEDGGACERCQNSIIGTQLSRCTQGHRACGLCLEEQVKLVLTGRQKGSLKCITSNCSSYYPMSELKHSLPNMVVEILEDKLDRDYVEYISDMMLSNATSNSSSTGTTTTTTATTTCASATSPPPPSTSKTTAEVQTSDNSDIDDNTDNPDDSDDDSDISTTSSSDVSSTTATNIKQKIKTMKVLPKSSSSSLSSLTADRFIIPRVEFDDDDSMSGDDDDAYDDITDPEEAMQQGFNAAKGGGSSSQDEKQKDFPDNWVKMDNNMTLLAVPLKPDSEEYIDVAFRFHTTMTFPQADITQILRIQNPIMWKYYSLKRLEMVQENDGLSVEEKTLFHGTKCSVIDAICRKGFDWRVCGKHGTAYGHGCYFARDSIYSHNYTDRTTDVNQASVVLRSVSASSGSSSEREGASSSIHLTPINLSSLNPQPSQGGSSSVPHHSRYHHISPGILGGRWPGGCRNLQGAASSQYGVNSNSTGSGGVSAGGSGSSSGSSFGKSQSHLMSQRQFLRKILARMNPIMYQPSGAAGTGGLQGMGSHPASYHKPSQPAKPILPKPVFPSSTSISSSGVGGSTSSSQGVSSHSGIVIGSTRQPSSSSSSSVSSSGPSSSKQKIVSVMVGPYAMPKPPPSQPGPGPGSAPQPLQGPAMGQRGPVPGAGPSGSLVHGFTCSLPAGGVMVGGSGSASSVPGPTSGFALGPLSSAHRNSLLFLSQQPPITPPHLLSHPISHLTHSHQHPPPPSTQSHLPPWVRLPAGHPPHGISELGKYCSGSRYMFLAKVLVGRSTGGNSGFRRPPPLDQNEPFGKCYDSCVDNIFDPKIFVIFDSNQAYPEYIIEYKFVE